MAESSPSVLVVVASKYGATLGIADAIAEALTAGGCIVATHAAEGAPAPAGFDAAVIGSGVYAGHWLKPARDYVEKHAEALTALPLWLFSSGPVGDPPVPKEDSVDLSPLERLDARDHQVFTGKLERSHLSFIDRAVVTAFRVPDGDFRDWPAIRAWGESVADTLRRA